MEARDARILELAGCGRLAGGRFEALVLAETGLSLTRFHQRLNSLLDDPEALAAAPQTVWRLRRLRDAGRGRPGEARVSRR